MTTDNALIRDIPGLGEVTLHSYLTLGQVSDIKSRISTIDPSERTSALADNLIAKLLIEPKKLPEEVAKLPADIIEVLVREAVAVLELQEKFEQTGADTSMRARLGEAYEADLRESMEGVSKAVTSALSGIYAGAEWKITSGLSDAAAKAADVNRRFDLSTQIGALLQQDAAVSRLADNMKQTWEVAVEPLRNAWQVDAIGSLEAGLKTVDMSAAWGQASALTDAVAKMNALSINIEMPAGLDAITKQMAAMDKVADRLRQAVEASNKPFIELVSDITRLHLPEPFLSETMVVSGLNSPLIHSPTYQYPQSHHVREETPEPTADVASHQRLVDAFDILSTLEQSLREFIEANLTEVHGDKWWKRAVPDDVREGCELRKARKEKPSGNSHHPIAYAYIGDYKKIIMRKDNWKAKFQAIFTDPTRLEASFTWVEEVRDSVAHSRSITDDEYVMYVAGARFLQIGVSRYLGR